MISEGSRRMSNRDGRYGDAFNRYAGGPPKFKIPLEVTPTLRRRRTEEGVVIVPLKSVHNGR